MKVRKTGKSGKIAHILSKSPEETQRAGLEIGRSLPVLGTEDGYIVGERPDARYPATTPQLHAAQTLETAIRKKTQELADAFKEDGAKHRASLALDVARVGLPAAVLAAADRQVVVRAALVGAPVDDVGIALVEVVEKFAKQKNATPAQVALAWVLAQKPWIVPIPGTTKLHRLRENIGGASLQLTPQDLRELEAAASAVAVQGARYPEHLQKLVGR